MNRRTFATGCSAAIAALAGGRLGGLSFARTTTQARDVLVVVSLRGGLDGLNLVSPADDPDFAAARPSTLRLAASGPEAGLPLANSLPGTPFLLHRAAAPLKELYDSGLLGIVHACGLVHGTRSHFEAMDLMERATARSRSAPGWMSRYLAAIDERGDLAAVAAGPYQPVALAGSSAISMTSPATFALPEHEKYSAQQNDILHALYRSPTALHKAGRSTLSILDAVAQKLPRDKDGQARAYEPEHEAEYPADDHAAELSTALQTVAQLIKFELGLQVATVDYGGWDTHEDQAGRFPALVDGFARSLAAFYNDLAHYHSRLTVIIISEFGRRLKANDSAGTDHGHGNVMLALGTGINGGHIYGNWPGLAVEQLDQGADLAITTDYRAVLGEILSKRASIADIKAIFPDFTLSRELGIASA